MPKGTNNFGFLDYGIGMCSDEMSLFRSLSIPNTIKYYWQYSRVGSDYAFLNVIVTPIG